MIKNNTPGKRVAILGYHKIGEPPVNGWKTWSYVSANIFEQQLTYLAKNNWEVIDSKAFLIGLKDPQTLPDRAILITFDDGYQSNLKVALPILKKLNLPAIIFVPVNFIGKLNAFDADIFYEPEEPICTWEELKYLDTNGISVQSHGLSHQRFSQLTSNELTNEVTQSKKFLEQQLNKQIDLFSYPYGDTGLDNGFTETILTRAGYTAACLYGGRSFDPFAANRYNLERIPVGADTDIKMALEI